MDRMIEEIEEALHELEVEGRIELVGVWIEGSYHYLVRPVEEKSDGEEKPTSY